MKNQLVVVFCTAWSFAFSADPKYPVSDIPAELKTDVNAVVRDERRVFKILSRGSATEHIYYAITIFNEQANHLATEVIGYDKLTKIKKIEGSVYDAMGKLIKRLKNTEIIDQSAVGGGTLYSDSRLKAFDLGQATYPYTVEIEYEVEYRKLFNIPDFIIDQGKKVSTQRIYFALQYPAGSAAIAPRYKLCNIDQQPAKVASDGLESLSWTFENVVPTKTEPLGPELTRQILVAPSLFEYDGYEGSMNSWNEFGQWIGTLNKNRNTLPEETKRKIKDLTEKLGTPEEKIRVLYDYLQSKTRYVSVQLGIGGYQPFEASVVDQTGYGDCKALSNYMVSMLEAAGIKAHYTLIDAGDDPKMNVDFPSSQFNHAVVFVPNKSDTIWLECTSQTKPFGYAGTFTGDRKALAITDNGAKVVWTPKYTAEQNVQSCGAEVWIDLKGNAKAKVKTTYSGLQYENGNLDGILLNQNDDQKKWIQSNTDIPSFNIDAFTMTNRKSRNPSATVEMDLTLNRLASASGKRLFLTPNLLNRSSFVPEKTESRKSKVIRKLAYTDLDTIRYHLPEEIYPEFLPQPVTLKSRFGEYESSFKVNQGSIVYTRKVIMKKGEFPPESYNELIEFFKNINKADNIKLVFLNKT